MDLPKSICLHILQTYVPNHKRLFVRHADWTAFHNAESKMMIRLVEAPNFVVSGLVLQNFLGLSHGAREAYVLQRAAKILCINNKKELKPLRRLIRGQSAELHSAVIKVAMTGCSLEKTLQTLACMVLQNEVASMSSSFSPKFFTFVHDIDDYLPRVCSRYLEMCLALVTGDDCSGFCGDFPRREDRVAMYEEALFVCYHHRVNEEY